MKWGAGIGTPRKVRTSNLLGPRLEAHARLPLFDGPDSLDAAPRALIGDWLEQAIPRCRLELGFAVLGVEVAVGVGNLSANAFVPLNFFDRQLDPVVACFTQQRVGGLIIVERTNKLLKRLFARSLIDLRRSAFSG